METHIGLEREFGIPYVECASGGIHSQAGQNSRLASMHERKGDGVSETAARVFERDCADLAQGAAADPGAHLLEDRTGGNRNALGKHAGGAQDAWPAD